MAGRAAGGAGCRGTGARAGHARGSPACRPGAACHFCDYFRGHAISLCQSSAACCNVSDLIGHAHKEHGRSRQLSDICWSSNPLVATGEGGSPAERGRGAAAAGAPRGTGAGEARGSGGRREAALGAGAQMQGGGRAPRTGTPGRGGAAEVCFFVSPFHCSWLTTACCCIGI